MNTNRALIAFLFAAACSQDPGGDNGDNDSNRARFVDGTGINGTTSVGEFAPFANDTTNNGGGGENDGNPVVTTSSTTNDPPVNTTSTTTTDPNNPVNTTSTTTGGCSGGDCGGCDGSSCGCNDGHCGQCSGGNCGKTIDIKTDSLCSDVYAITAGSTSVSKAPGVTAHVYRVPDDAKTNLAAEFGEEVFAITSSAGAAAIRNSILSSNKFSLPLDQLGDGKYTVLLCDADMDDTCKNRKGQRLYVVAQYNSQSFTAGPFGASEGKYPGLLGPTRGRQVVISIASGTAIINYGSGTTQSLPPYKTTGAMRVIAGGWKQIDSSTNYYDDSDENPICTTHESPLMVDLSGDGLNLSTPAAGALFDIRGLGDKRQLSWPQKRDDMFLVLPNAAGEVESVQQLFGNNTVGPDGKSAANGFSALAKFDSDASARIDAKDPVFSSLRLWHDDNRDGRAQSDELDTLSAHRIRAISTAYVFAPFSDSFGNQLRELAFIELDDNTTRPIIDVWFATR